MQPTADCLESEFEGREYVLCGAKHTQDNGVGRSE